MRERPVAQREERGGNDVTAEQLLTQIADYCRMVGMAESTFGRRAVNDGKLVGRLRVGGRVTTDTVERVRSFIRSNPKTDLRKPLGRLRSPANSLRPSTSGESESA